VKEEIRALRRVSVERVRDGRPRAREEDVAAAEEPLQILVDREPFAVVMRTPGDDRHLTAGFLFAERIITRAANLTRLEPCIDAEHDGTSNVIEAALSETARIEAAERLAARRKVVASAACGLCGRVTIESLQVEAPYIRLWWRVSEGLVSGLPSRLRERQAVFAETGGLHAAGLFAIDGSCEAIAEDVGRHNAVDKVIGRMLLAGRLPLGESMLAVSGRSSFEIVQKAFLAGIPLIAAVSAPSSLAIDLAGAAGITLLGFVRDGGFNVYTHAERIQK
jgi:FdhD protein